PAVRCARLPVDAWSGAAAGIIGPELRVKRGEECVQRYARNAHRDRIRLVGLHRVPDRFLEHLVRTAATVQIIPAGATNEGVIPAVSLEAIVSGAAIKRVVAGSSMQVVVTKPSQHDVITAVTV